MVAVILRFSAENQRGFSPRERRRRSLFSAGTVSFSARKAAVFLYSPFGSDTGFCKGQAPLFSPGGIARNRYGKSKRRDGRNCAEPERGKANAIHAPFRKFFLLYEIGAFFASGWGIICKTGRVEFYFSGFAVVFLSKNLY